MALARMTPASRASGAIIRWPAAIAAILGGYLLSRGMSRAFGARAAITAALAWFGSLAVIDRSGGAGLDVLLGPNGAGLDLTLGVVTLAAIDRVLGRGCDWVAGLWAALAFLVGGWPPLMLLGLTIIVIGRPDSRPGVALILPPLVTVFTWSLLTIKMTTPETWAAAMAMPLTRGIDGSLLPRILLLGLPWLPFALVSASRAAREAWSAPGENGSSAGSRPRPPASSPGRPCRVWARPLAPSRWPAFLSPPRRGWRWPGGGRLPSGARRTFFTMFSIILIAWLVAMIVGCFTWIVTMPYYRALGVVAGFVAIGVTVLGWSVLESGNTRRGVVTLVVMAIGLKLAHWGYYAPEWNYRQSQGPWGRAIGQWVPRKWPIYTFDPWPDDLAFYIGRSVRRLPSPRFLNYEKGPECRFVLIRTSDYEHWPENSPPLSVIARFLDASGEERILARTPGYFPVPTTSQLGQSAVTDLRPVSSPTPTIQEAFRS